jgi:ectoine hydroxylase-related dioxygenase (phytanoyl-CoA dioxygenase family)
MSETEISSLPDLTQPYSLSDQQISNYQQNGHVLLREVATQTEIAAYRPVIKEAAYRYNTEVRPLSERDTYGKAFLQIMNLWTKDQAVQKFVLAQRFARIAAELMGVAGVRLYHDQALFKEAGGGPTPWHQDQYYWPLDTTKTVTMWMPLTDISVEMGPMTFVSGSYHFGYLGKFPISDESQSRFEQFIKERDLSLSYGTAMAAGDATFHSGWMLHSAPENITNSTREAMTIIYFADGARIAEPENKNQENDLKTWLPDLKPGDLAASPLNPLLYKKASN